MCTAFGGAGGPQPPPTSLDFVYFVCISKDSMCFSQTTHRLKHLEQQSIDILLIHYSFGGYVVISIEECPFTAVSIQCWGAGGMQLL